MKSDSEPEQDTDLIDMLIISINLVFDVAK